MPRTYVRTPGSRQYVNYESDTLEAALDDIKKGRKCLQKASGEYRIPLSTLKSKKYGLHTKSYGGQKRLSTECEGMIASAINTLADWAVPMTGVEVRIFVKDYLDAMQLSNVIFKNNMPGKDWLNGFMNRHRLTRRMADNVSASRAKITPEAVNCYFDHLAEELRGIPPSNIFNYDETNIRDDPGAVEVIVSRGRRRIERLAEHSKESTSIMFCGNAAGEYLPPMIVYKCGSGNVYEGWIEGGPQGTEYASTKSGWFDAETFKQWFFNMFVRAATKLDGPVVLIGDNLASHFSTTVIEATLKYNIKFITMPPMSTHLCQPLDVAVFRILKQNWRNILDRWRKTSRHRGSIPKTQIPKLVLDLCSHLAPNHLKSGFRASGIYPLDRQQVLKRLRGLKQGINDADVDVLNESVIGMLRDQVEVENTKRYRTRGRKITHGKRIVSVVGDCSLPESAETHCSRCNGVYAEDGDDNWIQCDKCDKWYHYQCSGLQYDEEDYDELELEDADFVCSVCS